MKVLRQVQPTPEQLTVIGMHQRGPVVIRGSAGSGKTTTALYRLKETVRFWQRRVRDGYANGPVRVLVLTYNRTLRGYIEQLARADIAGIDVELHIDTFGRWAWHAQQCPEVVRNDTRSAQLLSLGRAMPFADTFLLDEVDYLTGRFLPADLNDYLTCERTGRGLTPRVAAGNRQRLLAEVVEPYQKWKAGSGLVDWNDLAVHMATNAPLARYHVIVVDETQDFSANQMRGVVAHLAAEHSASFVLDGAQRIYPQRFQWNEVGLTVGPANSRHLGKNFRNTIEIASFAAPLLKEVEVTDDGSLPDFSACTTHGPRPVLVEGKFNAQLTEVIRFLTSLDPDAGESVAILHAKGWFAKVRERLDAAGLAYVTITRKSEWPSGPESIALSTMHSVKGLEFDHVVIVGLNSATMPHGAEEGDSERDAHLRLLAMAIGRARKSVMLSYKPQEASDLIACLDPATYDRIGV